ncbi:MAG: inositol monophosphatase family protein [Oscillatoriales cyanobacterium SM2_2_1]|nr:inositol monophosphatase family protein [Oscillatoriales cyanobacterium SM2_2_1]
MNERDIGTFVREMGDRGLALRSQMEVFAKGEDDFVTNVDRMLDRWLSQQFQQWFPRDMVISEENADSFTQWGDRTGDCWLIDPIDGTDDFIHGRSHYAVMVGRVAEEPIEGWIYAPALQTLTYGHCSGVVWQEPEPGPLQQPAAGDRPVILSSKDERVYGDAIRSVIPGVNFYSLGSFGLKVLEVVFGRAQAYLYLNRRVKLWDTAAPLAIAKGAGLRCCDLSGAPIQFAGAQIVPETLAHRQIIVIGWPDFLRQHLSHLERAIAHCSPQ